MERILDLKKGDKCVVAIEEHSNASRHVDMSMENIDNWTYEGEVLLVTKKYITVKFKTDIAKFEIENNYRKKVTRGTCDHELNKDIQELKDIKEAKNLTYKIFGVTPRYNDLSLDKLKRIYDIINE